MVAQLSLRNIYMHQLFPRKKTKTASKFKHTQGQGRGGRRWEEISGGKKRLKKREREKDIDDTNNNHCFDGIMQLKQPTTPPPKYAQQ